MLNSKKDIYSLNSPVLDSAIDRVVVKMYQQKQKNNSKVFLVCGCEPAVGTTSIAINLAISAASAGWQTILIDADMRKESKYKRLNESEQGLSECLSGNINTMEDLFLLTNHERLHYLSAGKPAINPINLFGSAQMDVLLNLLRHKYDFIIIDAPSPLAAVDSTLIGGLSDDTVIVARWDHTTVNNIRQTKSLLEDGGANILGIVLNRMDNVSYKRMNKSHSYFIDQKYKNSKATDARQKQWQKGDMTLKSKNNISNGRKR